MKIQKTNTLTFKRRTGPDFSILVRRSTRNRSYKIDSQKSQRRFKCQKKKSSENKASLVQPYNKNNIHHFRTSISHFFGTEKAKPKSHYIFPNQHTVIYVKQQLLLSYCIIFPATKHKDTKNQKQKCHFSSTLIY